MAKSLRSTPGQKQTYNLYDPDDIYRAQKAINERINDIAKTFSTDSQIYRDYVAPMTVGALAPHVRIDKYGLTKFKTGKDNKNSDVVYTLERMLNKSTAGEILQRTAEQMDLALNMQHAKSTGRKKIANRREVVAAAKSIHELELQVYGRLDELYEMAEKELGNREKAKEYINKQLGERKFLKDIKASHGKLSDKEIRYAARYLEGKDAAEMLKFKPKTKRTTKNTNRRKRK